MARKTDLLIIGGGSAGLAAAVSARESGIEDIVVLERENALGGILNQCIHNGFGLHTFKQELTGPEYAARYVERVREMGIECLCGTMVLSLDGERRVTAINSSGLLVFEPRAVILAMGCRERPRGALVMPGTRPAGVITAGAAQKLVNCKGVLPGRDIVILGSGDIGLIMARRMTLQGAKVHAVVELMPYSSGLARNIVQCVEDFDIPLFYSHTVIDIEGEKRVRAVTVAAVDAQRRPVAGSERRFECDTLMLSVGLLPETELAKQAGIALDRATRGAVVDENLMTSLPGVFSCGNVLHVHDLVDNVSAESHRAGEFAAAYIKGNIDVAAAAAAVSSGDGVSGCVPQLLRRPQCEQTLMFRPTAVCRDAFVCVDADGECVVRQKRRVLTPGEMAEIKIKAGTLPANAQNICVRVERSEAQ